MENSKLTPIQLVERYHEKYLEYEKAFNKEPFTQEDLQKKLQEVANSGITFDSKEFEETVIDLMIEKPTKRSDVNNSALKFFLYAEFYLATQEEDLPEKIKKDYDNLPIADTMKPFYSVKDGEFVRNEEVPINVNKEELRGIYQALQKQQ